jgi:hypothetical protein
LQAVPLSTAVQVNPVSQLPPTPPQQAWFSPPQISQTPSLQPAPAAVQVCPAQQVSPTLPHSVQMPVDPGPAPVQAVPASVQVRLLVPVPQQDCPLAPQAMH